MTPRISPKHQLADDLVFRDEIGGPCVPMIFTQRFQKASRNAGVPQIRFHDLRHGHCTYLMEAGVPLPVIAQRVGRSSVAVTGATYSHVRPEVRDDTAALGAALVFGPSAATGGLPSNQARGAASPSRPQLPRSREDVPSGPRSQRSTLGD